MPLRSDIVGQALEPFELTVSPRMILAFSSVIGEIANSAFDDTSTDFSASPLFCVRPEWQFVLSARRQNLGLAADEAVRGVHAGQYTRFQSRLRPGSRIRVTGSIVAVRKTRAGALTTTQMETSDIATGTLIATTSSDGMYRGVGLTGDDNVHSGIQWPGTATPRTERPTETRVPLDRWFAHRYTECADIWNPIHTEQRVAKGAGLPGTIVHGTALWALAGKTIADAYRGGDTRALKALGGRFSAMVTAGTAITIRHARAVDDVSRVAFSVLNSDGQVAVSNGLALLDRPT